MHTHASASGASRTLPYLDRVGDALLRAAAVGALLAVPAACSSDHSGTTGPTLGGPALASTPLVADAAGLGAGTVDTALVNAWGLAFSPSGILWVSNNHTGTSTLYDTTGARRALVVTIPTSGAAKGGTPTGIVFNPTTDFVIPGRTRALFIFAGEDGTITGWSSGTAAAVVADRSTSGAVYKGLALAASGGANYLFATNFKQNAVDVFDAHYQYVKSFTDPGVPAGYAPFGIQAIGGALYVTFARRRPPDNEDDAPGPGNGFVDVFNTDGTLARRLASNGTLDSPWGLAIAPAGYGTVAGDLLVGNFGDGRVSIFDPTTGKFVGLLHDANGQPLTIPGLWALTPTPNAASSLLFYSAGPSGESHGVIGTLKPM